MHADCGSSWGDRARPPAAPARASPDGSGPHSPLAGARTPSPLCYTLQALMANRRTLVALVLILVGLLAAAVGVIYLTVEATSLPSIMGQLHGDHAHRSLRGIVAVIVAVVLLAGGVGFLSYGRSPR